MKSSICKLLQNSVEDEFSSDAALMEALAQQQPKALEQLHRRYVTVLWHAIMGVLRDESEAADVLQDVFIQIWKCAGDYSPDKGRLEGWLATLARRRALDRVRQRRAYHHVMERLQAEYRRSKRGLVVLDTPERVASMAEASEILNQSLRNLPRPQAEVIALSFFQDLSQREIAAGLGLPLGTVKSWIELGVRKLTRLLPALRHDIR